MADQPQADAAAVTALAAAYQRQVQQQRAALEAYITRLWRSLGTYRNAQMTAFATQAVPVVTGAQQNVASLTAAYLARHRQLRLGDGGRPVAVDVKRLTGTAVRNGTPLTQVYERPFHLVWRQLGDGTAPADAIQAGLDRAVQLAVTDVQLAKTHTTRQVLGEDRRVVGYYRELEGPHSCALCIVASTQRYHKRDLMPIHPACDCQPRPIYADDEPAPHVLDADRLAAAHDAIRREFGRSDAGARQIPGADAQYRDVLIVHDHGELGPVLAVRHRPFRGPKDVGTDPRMDAAVRAAQQDHQQRGESLLANLTAAVDATRRS